MEALFGWSAVDMVNELSMEKLKQLLFSPGCFETFVHDLDFTNAACLKATLSKGLSLGIVGGSFLLKVPQIVKILASHSAHGISLLSVFLEMVVYTVSVSHHLRQENPIMVWFENLNLAGQNAIILLLVIIFNGQYGLGAAVVGLSSAIVYALQNRELVDDATLNIIVSGIILLVIAARVPQIIKNFQNRSTGQLSAITLLLTFGGSAARTFTTAHETPDDRIMLYSYLVAVTLNAILVGQLVLYWKQSSPSAPARPQKAQRVKRKAD